MRGERAAGLRAGRLLPWALATATAAFAAAGEGLRASECEGDGTTPPTPTAVAVESVPITVPSTAAEYFVLYVTHDLGDGDVREVPVSVTRGEEGATALEWNLSGLPASRYRVEKYRIDDPGDVDGDCRDDLTDPNPVSPARELEFSDGLNLLSSSEQWDEIYFDAVRDGCPECEFFGPGTRYLKLHVARPASRPPAIYVINARTHWAHPIFRSAVGLRSGLSLELDRETGLAGTGPEVDTYYWWFSTGEDAVESAGLVPWLHSAVAASLPIMPAEASEWRLAYYIPDIKWDEPFVEALLPRLAGYEGAGVPVLRDRSFRADLPNISVLSDQESVTEGRDATFTLTADPPPREALDVLLQVVESSGSDFLHPGRNRGCVDILGPSVNSGYCWVKFEADAASAVLTISIADDEVNGSDGVGIVSVAKSSGYLLGIPRSARVSVVDNDDAPPPPPPPPPPESDPPPPPPPPPTTPPPPTPPPPPESDPPPPAGPPPGPPAPNPAPEPEPEPEPEPAGPLKADFTVDADCSSDPCRLRTGVRVVFSDSSGGRVVGRRWSFGDGSTSRGLSPAHEYRSPGFYEVSLTVSDGTEESVAARVFLVEAGEPAGACVGGASTRCLRDSRFAVEVEWTGPGGAAGAARVVHAGTNDSALFSFFDRANWEVLAKVLDGCAVNGSFWVFAASTTDLEFTIRVIDTVTGRSRAYSNEAGAAPAVADTEAFPGACGNGRGR